MMSLSQFRTSLFKVFPLMRDTKLTIEVYHRRKVYRVNIEETGEKVKTPYKRKPKSSVVPNAMISTDTCSECEALKVNGICMNQKCPTNLASPALTD